MAGRDGWSDGGGGTKAVLAGTERTAPPGDAGGRRAGGGVGRARRAVEVPVVAGDDRAWRRLGVVDEDLRRPLGHRRRRIGERVPGRRRGRAGQGSVVQGAVVERRSVLGSRQRR